MNYNGGRGREISWKHVCMPDSLNLKSSNETKEECLPEEQSIV